MPYCNRGEDDSYDGHPHCCGGKSLDPHRHMNADEVVTRVCRMCFFGGVCPYLEE